MAVTQNSYTGNGSTTNYSFTFPYLKTADVKCSIDATETTAFTLANATTVQFNSAPANGAKIKIFRETDDSDLTATFYAGSAIKSSDLNDNFTQNLYTTQEVNARYLSNLGGTMLGDLAMGEDADIIFEGATDNTNETKLTVADPTADRTITFPDVTGTVVTTGDTGTVTSTMIADDTIANADISTSAAIAQSKLNIANATTSASGYQSAADKTKLDGIETGATADQTASEIRTLVENASDSNVFTDADHTKLNGIETAATADQTDAEIRAAVGNANDSNVLTDALKNKLDGIEASATADQTASEIKSLIASSPLDASHLAPNSVTTSEIADSELTTLAGMPSATASKLADSTALTSDIADLNQIDGLTKQTTISDSDASFPTSGAVVDYVAAQIAPLGGLEVIATEVAFPNTQPSAGVVISISDAGGVVFNGSGTSTTGRTVGGSTVTINNAPSSLNSETLAAGVGLMVSSTGSGQVYNYHKILGKEEDIKQLSDDINDFNARYRVGSSNPTSALDAGDLFFNTSTSKLLVYNATNSAWEEAQSIGNFFISTFSESFDGSRTAFTISNAPANAQQLIISINGVIQKPNSGTGQPSEGFTLSGSTVTFSAAIPSGSNYFAVVLGSTVNIGTPSDNTVTTAILQNGSVTNDKVSASAAIAGTKISPDFGSQNIVTTGGLTVDTNTLHVDTTNNRVGIGTTSPSVSLDIEATTPTIRLTDSDATGTPECQITGGGGDLVLSADRDNEKSGTKIQFQTDGSTKITIDEVGRLGVGTTSPSGFNAYGNTLVAATSTNTGLTLSGNDASTNYSGLHFSAGTTVRGYLDQQLNSTGRMQLMNMAAGHMAFGTSNTVRMTIGSTGDVELTENLKVASGKGINFHAYATSGNPSSNLLDDYEEGVWTPEIQGTNGTTPTSYYHQDGAYTKIGRLVTLLLRIRINDATGLSGDMRLDNLPFNVQSVLSSTSLAGFGHPSYFTSANSNLTTLLISPVAGGDTANFYGQASASTGVGSLSTTYINSGFDMRAMITYYAA